MTPTHPLLHREVTIDPPIDEHAVVHDAGRRKYFRIGAREAAFLAGLDGSVPAERLREEGREGFSVDQIDGLLQWCVANRLLDGTRDEADEAALLPRWRRALNYLVYPDRFRFTLFNPDRFLDRHHRAIGALFGRGAVALYLLVFLSPTILLVGFPDSFAAAFASYEPEIPVWQWVALYAAMLVITFLHEMAHALACKHYGGKVEVVGLMLLYLNPVAYCDISASWRFSSPAEKVVVSGAGIFFQLLVAAASFAAFGMLHATFFAYLAIANAFFALFNLIPFVKLDGYWMLVHLTGEPNLRSKSLAVIDGGVRRLLGRPAGNGGGDRLLLAFGLAQLLFVPLFWLLGLAAIYRVAGWLSPSLALWVCLPFAALLAYRLARSGSAYWVSLNA